LANSTQTDEALAKENKKKALERKEQIRLNQELDKQTRVKRGKERRIALREKMSQSMAQLRQAPYVKKGSKATNAKYS